MIDGEGPENRASTPLERIRTEWIVPAPAILKLVGKK